MNITDILIGTVGGGVIGVAAKAASDAFVASRRADVELAKVGAREEQHGREVTERFALDALDSKRKADETMREQSAQITALSVQVAHCDEQHKATKIELDITKQLAERQRVEIARLQGEVVSLSASLDDLRKRFDSFVAGAMGISRLSEVPGAK